MKKENKEAMHNVKKSFKRTIGVSLCASCVLSNGMLSLAEGAEDKAVNLALGCQATANAQYNQNGNDIERRQRQLTQR